MLGLTLQLVNSSYHQVDFYKRFHLGLVCFLRQSCHLTACTRPALRAQAEQHRGTPRIGTHSPQELALIMISSGQWQSPGYRATQTAWLLTLTRTSDFQAPLPELLIR